MIDAALSSGNAQYTVDENSLSVSFHAPEDESDAFLPMPTDLTENETAVLTSLQKRGASFARSMAGACIKSGVGETLFSLLQRGLVRSDSFAPVRYLKHTETGNLKSNVRQRVSAIDAGRWEAVRVKKDKTAEENWQNLLSALRNLEYAGKVRRGYFVKGLSGAQFVRESDFESVVYLLKSPFESTCVLSALDPMQPYGKILPHADGRAFSRLASTAVALQAGMPVAVFEKNGEAMRIFDGENAQKAASAFADAFKNGSIFPHLKKITVKSFDPAYKDALSACGFQSDMMYMTLFKV